MKKLRIPALLLLFFGSAYAQEEETITGKAAETTVFTGMDYVRLVTNKAFVQSSSAAFKATITASADRKILWEGNVTPGSPNEEGKVPFSIKDLKPALWTPTHPCLYELKLQQFDKGSLVSTIQQRIGFRFFEAKGGRLYLNGKPVFLRGIAINPPGRGIPEALERSRAFAVDYVGYMKSIHVNIIRIPDAEEWFDVCDSLGMMVFGGNYSGKVAGGEKVEAQAKAGDETDGVFPGDYDKGVRWYENEKLGAVAHHPSLMVYAMTNETPFAGERARRWEKFLDYAYNKLKAWDETRVYIANAGYGYGKTGDITDLHRYWGWYYSSPFTFLHIRNEAEINPYPSPHKPLTFTECVGNYTGPDGRYNLTPAHKNPSAQLAWTGHAAQEVQAQLADYHQSFTFRQATETFRQLRRVNPALSGVFPFTILFYNWNTITRFDDMKPKPVTEQVRLSYQPVLLSWECWTPNVYAGSVIKPVAHLVNDADDFTGLTAAKLVYEIKDKAQQVVFSDSTVMGDVPYYATAEKSLSITLPSNLVTGRYRLSGRLVSRGKTVSQNVYDLFIADAAYAKGGAFSTGSLLLHDVQGITQKAFSAAGIRFSELKTFTQLPPGSTLVIGENSADKAMAGAAASIKKFIGNGGRLLCLRQDSVHLANVNALLLHPLVNNNVDVDDPAYPVSAKAPRNGYYLNPERPEHPLFTGITRENLRVWSDYTGWDETAPGFPAIKPVTDGFTLSDREDIGNTAVLANYGSGLQAIALAEQFWGRGSVILCGLDLANRTGLDPVAARLMVNLVDYAKAATGHALYQLVTAPVVWGEYETEKGIVTDLYSGFLVNSTPRVPKDYLGKGIAVTKEGYQLAGGNRSGFNTRPGIQYVANGRRPFGPFVQSFGGQPQPDKTPEGFGSFWCRIPPGQNNMTTVVWNPGTEPLTLKIKVNGLKETAKAVAAGEKLAVDASVDGSEVHVTYTGDRRLVILETAFNRKN